SPRKHRNQARCRRHHRRTRSFCVFVGTVPGPRAAPVSTAVRKEQDMVVIEGRYVGDLRCEATHGPSGTKLVTDAPTDNMGKGEAFSPTDLVATALGT